MATESVVVILTPAQYAVLSKAVDGQQLSNREVRTFHRAMVAWAMAGEEYERRKEVLHYPISRGR
jgi:uncharacterized protein YqiB (DUF1249 family)